MLLASHSTILGENVSFDDCRPLSIDEAEIEVVSLPQSTNAPAVVPPVGDFDISWPFSNFRPFPRDAVSSEKMIKLCADIDELVVIYRSSKEDGVGSLSEFRSRFVERIMQAEQSVTYSVNLVVQAETPALIWDSFVADLLDENCGYADSEWPDRRL